MYDFNKIFNPDRKAQYKCPDELIDFFGKKDLPSDLEYKKDKNGNYIVVGKTGKFKIDGIKVILSKEQEKDLGSYYTFDDLMYYFYNSQKTMQLEPIEEGFIILNGKKVALEKLMVKSFLPYETFKLVDGKFHMIPSKFPDPFSIKIGNRKYSRELIVARVPNNSKYILKYQSDTSSPLIIDCTFNRKTKEISFNISLKLQFASSTKDIVESVMIYNSIIDGNGYVDNVKLQEFSTMQNNKKFDENSAAFWEKLLKIETELGIKFDIPKEDVEFNIICEVEELYQNLIKKKPIKFYEHIDCLNGNWEGQDLEIINKNIGKSFLLQFNTDCYFNLFSKKIKLPTINIVYNSVLKSIENNNKLLLDNENLNKKMFIVKLCFKNEKELNEYMKNHKEKIFCNFKSAKTIQEYLK